MLDSMAVELILLIVLVVGIVLIGIGVLHYTRRAVGYAGRRVAATYGHGARVAGYVARNARRLYQAGEKTYGRSGFTLSPLSREESGTITAYTKKGIPIIRDVTVRTLETTPLELAFEIPLYGVLRQHERDFVLEPELEFLFETVGGYARRAIGVARDVITGWIDREGRERRRQHEVDIAQAARYSIGRGPV